MVKHPRRAILPRTAALLLLLLDLLDACARSGASPGADGSEPHESGDSAAEPPSAPTASLRAWSVHPEDTRTSLPGRPGLRAGSRLAGPHPARRVGRGTGRRPYRGRGAHLAPPAAAGPRGRGRRRRVPGHPPRGRRAPAGGPGGAGAGAHRRRLRHDRRWTHMGTARRIPPAPGRGWGRFPRLPAPDGNRLRGRLHRLDHRAGPRRRAVSPGGAVDLACAEAARWAEDEPDFLRAPQLPLGCAAPAWRPDVLCSLEIPGLMS